MLLDFEGRWPPHECDQICVSYLQSHLQLFLSFLVDFIDIKAKPGRTLRYEDILTIKIDFIGFDDFLTLDIVLIGRAIDGQDHFLDASFRGNGEFSQRNDKLFVCCHDF